MSSPDESAAAVEEFLQKNARNNTEESSSEVLVFDPKTLKIKKKKKTEAERAGDTLVFTGMAVDGFFRIE